MLKIIICYYCEKLVAYKLQANTVIKCPKPMVVKLVDHGQLKKHIVVNVIAREKRYSDWRNVIIKKNSIYCKMLVC